MLFNSYPFLFGYLPVVLIVFFILSAKHLVQAAKSWLLLSSLFFYGFWDIRFLPLLLASIFFNYHCGRLILNIINGQKRKLLLILALAANLSLLFYFKYFNFFISNVLGSSSTFEEIILPLGISFFTFTQIAYLVDAYQQKANHSDIISYGLFVTVFPHLIAGPILHHKQMLNQFNSHRMYVLQWPNLAYGIFLFVAGLSKKVLLADSLSGYVKNIFDAQLTAIPFVQAWFGALTYTLQLYFDFSGYSDMAVGLGLMLNLKLPINFNSPYKADSIIDFWRRWHITLSIFLKDYLYIPLGGNRSGKFSHLRNLMLTMLLGGLWHGAGWTFIIWGAAHGTFLIINHLWKELNIPLPNFIAKFLTLLAVVIAWVIFRSPDMETASNILRGMFGFNGIVLPLKYEKFLGILNYIGITFGIDLRATRLQVYDILVMAFIFIGALVLPNSQEWLEKFKRHPKRWAIPCALLFVFTLLNVDDMAEFLYYQF